LFIYHIESMLNIVAPSNGISHWDKNTRIWPKKSAFEKLDLASQDMIF